MLTQPVGKRHHLRRVAKGYRVRNVEHRNTVPILASTRMGSRSLAGTVNGVRRPSAALPIFLASSLAVR